MYPPKSAPCCDVHCALCSLYLRLSRAVKIAGVCSVSAPAAGYEFMMLMAGLRRLFVTSEPADGGQWASGRPLSCTAPGGRPLQCTADVRHSAADIPILFTQLHDSEGRSSQRRRSNSRHSAADLPYLIQLAAVAGRCLRVRQICPHFYVGCRDTMFAVAAERASVQLLRAGDSYCLIRVNPEWRRSC